MRERRRGRKVWPSSCPHSRAQTRVRMQPVLLTLCHPLSWSPPTLNYVSTLFEQSRKQPMNAWSSKIIIMKTCSNQPSLRLSTDRIRGKELDNDWGDRGCASYRTSTCSGPWGSVSGAGDRGRNLPHQLQEQTQALPGAQVLQPALQTCWLFARTISPGSRA